jgi:dGTPase
VGNPAFGHSGEDAIASFFEKNETELKSKFTEKEWADLVNFEGNANAIRVLTHQQTGKDEGGTQLTFTTLASIAKYPCEAIAKKKGYVNRKKFGFFQNEKSTFLDIAKATNMIVECDEPIIFKRHPFVWLVEAADDICYNIIDMEDAHRLGVISTSDCENLFSEVIKDAKADDLQRVKDKLCIISNPNEKISYLRAKVINALITKTLEIYKKNFKEILNHFIPPIIKEKSARKGFEEKALQLLPNQFRYENGTTYQKVLGVLDFVSGMTDNFATDLYRKIKGIDIGMTM